MLAMYDIDKLILQEYSGQSGYGSLPYFAGRQYGTGWFRNIARVAFPFLRKALGFVGNVAANTAQDMINDENKKLGSTLVEHATNELSRAVKRRGSTINTSDEKRPKLIV